MVSVVRQSPGLFTDTIENNIAYSVNSFKQVTEVEVVQSAQLANAHSFITKLSGRYQTMLGDGHGNVQLSGGQKQRIAIARAILKDSSLLVMFFLLRLLMKSPHCVKGIG
jgi:ABC-type multidrug transport system fused ATPase/permease subunit